MYAFAGIGGIVEFSLDKLAWFPQTQGGIKAAVLGAFRPCRCRGGVVTCRLRVVFSEEFQEKLLTQETVVGYIYHRLKGSAYLW